LSTQHPQATPILPAADAPQTRASDADRDAAVALLGAAFAEGRLTADEHGERLSAAYAARTWQQLRQLTADLPGTAGATGPRAAPRTAAGPDRCLLCLVLIVCPPAGITWWLLSRRHLVAARTGRRALPWREDEHAQDR
jgi:hypothetical protein